MKFKSSFKLIITVSVVAFVLHLIWEYLQCIPFFIHGDNNPTHLSMINASLGDVVLTWIAFLIISLVYRDWNWVVKDYKMKHWIIILICALLLSITVEAYGLNTGRWTYTETNPLIFNKISIIPILQLLILFPLTFTFSKKISRLF